MKVSSLFLVIMGLLVASTAHTQFSRRAPINASDLAPLDPPYENLIHPKKSRIRPLDRDTAKSDTLAIIKYQSPVRSQQARGTCSIFSATARLEGALIQTQGLPATEVDLSEEWLQYLAMQGSTVSGSHTSKNMRNLQQFGTVLETTWPYVGAEWKDTPTLPVAKATCGRFAADYLRHISCLLGHRDPNNLLATDAELKTPGSDTYDPKFLKIRTEAQQFHAKFLKGRLGATSVVYNTDEIKALLRAGQTLLLDHSFFYGAYNHRKTEELGLERNMDHWHQGLIGYPAPDSLDLVVSKKNPAGHSVLVVGYDDTRSITVRYQRTNGSYATRTYYGVYYIKNSWGTDGFGSEFQIDGVSYPGYGAFSQDYAHDYGSFYKTNIR